MSESRSSRWRWENPRPVEELKAFGYQPMTVKIVTRR
jgi:hypothetical protein